MNPLTESLYGDIEGGVIPQKHLTKEHTFARWLMTNIPVIIMIMFIIIIGGFCLFDALNVHVKNNIWKWLNNLL